MVYPSLRKHLVKAVLAWERVPAVLVCARGTGPVSAQAAVLRF